MIFRNSLSEEKQGVLSRLSVVTTSSSSTSTGSSPSHNDDVTLLDDLESSTPSFTGKYVNKSARKWVEAGLDWRIQWGCATGIYVLVVLLAYFFSYRDQYNSVIITTLREDLSLLDSGATGKLYPQVVLLADANFPSPRSQFSPARLGVTLNMSSAQEGDVSWCYPTTALPPLVQIGPYISSILALSSCQNPQGELRDMNLNIFSPIRHWESDIPFLPVSTSFQSELCRGSNSEWDGASTATNDWCLFTRSVIGPNILIDIFRCEFKCTCLPSVVQRRSNNYHADDI